MRAGSPARDFVEAVGGLPKSKVHCSVLAAGALKKALAAYDAAPD